MILMKLIPCLFTVVLIGCSSTIDYRGKKPEPEALAKIQPGVHTQEDVLSLIGSPTNTSLYGTTKWFYVFKKTESKSFCLPITLEEQILTIAFDPEGKVTDLTLANEGGQIIDHVSYKTPTHGGDRSFLQQVFGNFGRYAKKAESK